MDSTDHYRVKQAKSPWNGIKFVAVCLELRYETVEVLRPFREYENFGGGILFVDMFEDVHQDSALGRQ